MNDFHSKLQQVNSARWLASFRMFLVFSCRKTYSRKKQICLRCRCAMTMPLFVVVFVISFGCIDLRIFSQDGWCVYVGFKAHQHSKKVAHSAEDTLDLGNWTDIWVL